MKKKKLWIILTSVVLSIVCIFGGLYFTTKLSNVSVELRSRLSETESRLPANITDIVKDSAEFNYKDSVLIMNTKKNIDKIEKMNPYVKVNQVIRKFPNKLYVYISERIPKYRIEDSENAGNWLILDEDFKILQRIENEDMIAEGLDDKTVNLEFISSKLNPGSFLDLSTEKTNLNEILTGVYGRTRDYFAVRSIDYLNEDNTFYLTMRTSVEGEEGVITYNAGCIIQIKAVGNIRTKSFNATCVYAGDGNQVQDKDLSRKVIIISEEDGCIVKNQG